MNTLQSIGTLTLKYDVDGIISEYVKTIDVKPTSRETYTRALRVFFHYYGLNLPTTKAEILAYKDYLIKNYKASTVNAYITAVKGFYCYLESEGIMPNITANIKGVKNSKDFKKDSLTIEQAKAIMSTKENSIDALRNRAIIKLMLYTGLRTIEVERANIEDIRQTGNTTLLYIQGKGRDSKDSFVILVNEVLEAINEYLTARGKSDPKEPLFTATSNRNVNGRLTTRSISRIVKNTMIENGINNSRLTAHSLRHSAVTFSLIGGASIQETQALARHSNINTTMIYAHNINRINNCAEKTIANVLK